MKVLMVTPYFYPHMGGLEQYAATVANELVARGHEVHVVTSGDGAAVEQWRGLTIHRLRAWFTLSNTPVNPLWTLQIRRLVREWRPDVLNVHAPVPTMALAAAAAAGGVPVVVTYHAGSMKKGKPALDALIAGFERVLLPQLLNRAAAIVCASDFVRHGFLAAWKHKSVTITPGVDTAVFVPGVNAPEAGRVVFVGDFRDPRKGLEVLLAAVKLLPGVNLRVVGQGRPQPQDGVSYAGVVRGAALVRELQAAQVLVLPSTTEAESFGMVLIEAMACGLAVVGSRIGGVPGVIDDGRDGLLVPPGDASALAGAIASLVHDVPRAIRLGQAGRRKVEAQFSWADCGERTEHVLQEATRG